MIPYFEQPSARLGPVTIHAFGALVAAAVVVGYSLAIRRSNRAGLDSGVAESVLLWGLVIGFIVAHLFAVLVYFPGDLRRNPLVVLRFWEDLSSFGGFFGGALGIALYFRTRRPELGSSVRRAYLDAIAFTFPFAWFFGRLACTIAHDHPGLITRFPLAVSLASPQARAYLRSVYEGAGLGSSLPPDRVLATMGFHDLGWYEFLFTAVVLVPLFLLLDRRSRPPGFFVAALILLYAPVRFALDFLRVSDARYLGLTPAQYSAILALLFGFFALRNRTVAEPSAHARG
jgi:phosphatidylglycerol:prolipoprotein diacylglycerol transferase